MGKTATMGIVNVAFKQSCRRVLNLRQGRFLGNFVRRVIKLVFCPYTGVVHVFDWNSRIWANRVELLGALLTRTNFKEQD